MLLHITLHITLCRIYVITYINNEVYNTYRIMYSVYVYSVLFIDFYLMPPHL